MKGNRILVGREVKEALNTGAPVVAMETGFLSHREGNRNHVADALQIMNTVRAHDAIPAVVAVDDGKMLVGMTEEELYANALQLLDRGLVKGMFQVDGTFTEEQIRNPWNL